MPGHTMFALGLGGTIDGVRVAYTGDNLLAGSLSPAARRGPDLSKRAAARLDPGRRGAAAWRTSRSSS